MNPSPARAVGSFCTFLALLASVGTCGCGSSSTKLSGKVSYNGQLLKGGNITFISQEGKPSVSTHINEDGTYNLPNAPTGKVKICVDTESLNPKNRKDAKSYSAPPGQKAPEGLGSGNAPDTSNRYIWIPEHYADPDKTTLTTEIKRGAKEYDVKLE